MLKKNKYFFILTLVFLITGMVYRSLFYTKPTPEPILKRQNVITQTETNAIKNSLLEAQKNNIRSPNVQFVLENNIEKMNQVMAKPKLEKDREQFFVQNLHFQMAHETDELKQISPKTWSALIRNLIAFIERFKDSPPAQSRSLVLASRLIGEIPSQNFPNKSKSLLRLVDLKNLDPDIGSILFSRLLKDDKVDSKVLIRAKTLVRTARPQLSASLAQSISQMKDNEAKNSLLKSMLSYFPHLPAQSKPYWLGLYADQNLSGSESDRLIKSIAGRKDDLTYEAILTFISHGKKISPIAKATLQDIEKNSLDPRIKNDASRLIKQLF